MDILPGPEGAHKGSASHPEAKLDNTRLNPFEYEMHEPDHGCLCFTPLVERYTIAGGSGDDAVATITSTARLFGEFYSFGVPSSADRGLMCPCRSLFYVSGTFNIPTSVGTAVRYDGVDDGLVPIQSWEVKLSAVESPGGPTIELYDTPQDKKQQQLTKDSQAWSQPRLIQLIPLQPIDAYVTTTSPGLKTNHSLSWESERLGIRNVTESNGKPAEAPNQFVLHLTLVASLADGTKLNVAASQSTPIGVRWRLPKLSKLFAKVNHISVLSEDFAASGAPRTLNTPKRRIHWEQTTSEEWQPESLKLKDDKQKMDTPKVSSSELPQGDVGSEDDLSGKSSFGDVMYFVKPRRKILLGYWKDSNAGKEVDKYEAFGSISFLDSLLIRVTRLTRDGRPFNGNNLSNVLYIKYDAVILEPHLAHLTASGVEEYVRIRMETLREHRNRETEAERVSNELKAVEEVESIPDSVIANAPGIFHKITPSKLSYLPRKTHEEPSKPRMIVKLKYKKQRANDIQHILDIRPRPAKEFTRLENERLGALNKATFKIDYESSDDDAIPSKIVAPRPAPAKKRPGDFKKPRSSEPAPGLCDVDTSKGLIPIFAYGKPPRPPLHS
jgi:hypothetical protein